MNCFNFRSAHIVGWLNIIDVDVYDFVWIFSAVGKDLDLLVMVENGAIEVRVIFDIDGLTRRNEFQ